MSEKISFVDTSGRPVSGHFEVSDGLITVTLSDGAKTTAEGRWQQADAKNCFLAKIACAMTLQHEKRKSFLNAYRKHLTDKTAFGPAAIETMSKAFEESCIALQVFAGDEKGREIIATRIIDLARNGLIDPTALRDRVIAEARLSE
jgi:hypothetical protein